MRHWWPHRHRWKLIAYHKGSGVMLFRCRRCGTTQQRPDTGASPEDTMADLERRGEL